VHGLVSFFLLDSIKEPIMSKGKRIKPVPIKQIRQEEGAHELATSPDMEPYVRFAMAVVQNADPTAALENIGKLPLEKRYVWRIASALKWAFADFDTLSVEADRQTLTPEDFAKLRDLLKMRPMQFSMFLGAFLGAPEAERILAQAMSMAKQSH
jgi:DNA-binding transcriptional regulator YiaG